jgi:signal transduction histidine kinase
VRAHLPSLGGARPDPVRTDWVLAAVLTLAGELQVLAGHIAGHGRISAAFAVAGFGAAVALRRSYPASAGLAAGILMPLVIALRGDPQIVSNAIGYLCALYALAVWAPARRFVLGATVIAATDLVPASRYGNRVIWALATLVIMLIVRRVVRDREERAQLAERQRDLAAREAVADERGRIARELHDVVAHSVSVIVVQAQAGPRLLGDPERVRSVFASIETTGRDALVELRRLLGILRTADEELAIGPQPSLDSLESLLKQLRQAGLDVGLRIEGEPVPLPPGLDLAAYRIVQEALTNTLKHAGPVEAEVVVRYRQSMLELEILDNGSAAPVESGGSGHGLIGMRERAALYGGVMEAGSRNGHGYAVHARLPIGQAPSG